LTYDLAGNRATQTLTVTGQSAQTTTYHWDAENRLEGVTLPNAEEHEYGYDYRTRRISRVENGIGTAIVFSGGLSVAEYESQGITPTVEYLRGPDMGGGVGGMMYSLRNGGTEAKYAMSNGRGDVVAQSNDAGALTWTASYEAYGKRPVETGTNLDRQRANTKEEDPTGLLNEGFRYRDIETGVWLSRDPAGFVDGPNVYAYVRQNPWTKLDPHGLNETLGWNNWFANWVLPDPVGSYRESGRQLDIAAGLDDEKNTLADRVGGGFGYVGHGISTVVDLVPIVGQLKKKLVVAAFGEVVERSVKNSADEIAEVAAKKADDLLSDSAKKTAQESASHADEVAEKASKKVEVSKSKYPESYEHAQSTGNPNGPFTKDAANASTRRRQNLKGQEKVDGKDLDEWPPAQTAEGKGASVKPINPGDNRGSGATIGGQTRSLKDGDKFEVEWTD
uniref:RHS repeat domain-containing protein n=1 Tax=Verrucomicrobium sp. BvORR034 TaxID=1396418 RepID=UPI002240FF9E